MIRGGLGRAATEPGFEGCFEEVPGKEGKIQAHCTPIGRMYVCLGRKIHK